MNQIPFVFRVKIKKIIVNILKVKRADNDDLVNMVKQGYMFNELSWYCQKTQKLIIKNYTVFTKSILGEICSQFADSWSGCQFCE